MLISPQFRPPLLAYAAFFLLASSGCNTFESRECPGFNYDTSQWVDYDLEETLRFRIDQGEDLVLAKSLTFKTDPGLQGGDNDICELFAIYQYESPTDEVGLEIEYWQREQEAMPVNINNVILTYRFNDLSVPQFITSHALVIEPFQLTGELDQRFLDSLSVNGVVYENVIESSRDTSFPSFNPQFDFWRVFLTEGAGLIRMDNRARGSYERVN